MNAIVAMTKKGVIGIDGRLPWHIPDDLERFRDMTIGSQVIMGRKTYESLGRRGLRGRTNIVLSRAYYESRPGVFFVRNRKQAIDIARSCEIYERNQTWVIGGAKIYHLFMAEIELYDVTYVNRPVAHTNDVTIFPEPCQRALDRDFVAGASIEVPWGTIVKYKRR